MEAPAAAEVLSAPSDEVLPSDSPSSLSFLLPSVLSFLSAPLTCLNTLEVLAAPLAIYCLILAYVKVPMIIADLMTSEGPPRIERAEIKQGPQTCWMCSAPASGQTHCERCGAQMREEKRPPGLLDECVLRGPCKLMGRYGRTTNAFTVCILTFCLHQAWWLLRPATLPLIGGTFSLASFVLHVVGVTCTFGVPFNFVATMYSSPGFVTIYDSTAVWKPLLHRVRAEPMGELEAEPLHQPLYAWRRDADTGLCLPPRSGYCRRCKQVVKKMDHHCAFVNTCIGHGNHHYFIRLLIMGLVSTLLESFFCVFVLLRTADGYDAAPFASLWRRVVTPEPWSPETRALLTLWLVATGVTYGLASLLLMQLANLFRGVTQLEAQKMRKPTDRVYNLGSARANLGAIFGARSLLEHLLPLPCNPVGDGYNFPVRQKVS